MLRLSVHAGRLGEESRFNRLDWLDIGYDKLAAVATYRVVLVQSGIGACPPQVIENYPRWSASLWDLVARAIALTLWPDCFGAREAVRPVDRASKRPAFVEAVTGVLEHFPALGPPGGRRVATIEVVQHKRVRGVYHARLDEDLQRRCSTLPFLFAPKVMRPAELVMRAALMRLSGDTEKLPPRPALSLPPAHLVNGAPYIEIRRLKEPARTGFERWLLGGGAPGRNWPEGYAPEEYFHQFMSEAL